MSDARKKNPETILKSLGVKKGMTLVDLCSGLGFFTIPMAETTGETGRVYAVDSDQLCCNIC